jgi:hypothetical protein
MYHQTFKFKPKASDQILVNQEASISIDYTHDFAGYKKLLFLPISGSLTDVLKIRLQKID